MGLTAHTHDLTSDERDVATTFPPQFLWGAATSAYQVEGATQADGRGPSIWDAFSATPGMTHEGHTGEQAAEHYFRMEHDVALMASLGLGAYRFSIAWPRIVPDGRGPINARGLDFYDRLVDQLLRHGIAPVATLYHWDLPLALQERGGWRDRHTAYAFAEYAAVVAARLGDRVARWITLNEPWCSAYLGYGIGVHAPGLHDMQAAVDAAHHLLLAHGLAVPLLRERTGQRVPVGITLNLNPIYATDARQETRAAQERLDLFHNRWFLDPIYRGAYPEQLFSNFGTSSPPIHAGDHKAIATPLDFLGINYYSRLLVTGTKRPSADPDKPPLFQGYDVVGPVPGSRYTQMGWEVYPDGLVDTLIRVQQEYAPPAIMVTENGAAYADTWDGGDNVRDAHRVSYLRKHIEALAVARMVGVRVDGYFAWSLLDNFEWAEGYSRRFGMVYVDYPSQRRIVKDSGRWYADFVARHRSQAT